MAPYPFWLPAFLSHPQMPKEIQTMLRYETEQLY